MTDQLPGMDIKETKIDEFHHVKLCCEYVGAHVVMDSLEALIKQFPNVAGIGLAIATAKAEVADIRTRMLTRNIKVAMKAGIDLDKYALTMQVKNDGIYLSAVEAGE
jgi:hypothetical protein